MPLTVRHNTRQPTQPWPICAEIVLMVYARAATMTYSGTCASRSGPVVSALLAHLPTDWLRAVLIMQSESGPYALQKGVLASLRCPF